MKTLTTYSPTERITWRMVGGVLRAVEIERDRSAIPEPEPVSETTTPIDSKYVCPSCNGSKQRRSRLCFDCTYRDSNRCIGCDGRAHKGSRHCRDCAHKRRTVPDMAIVERVLSGEWTIETTRADRLEVIKRWTGSNSELTRLTGWHVWRLMKQAREAA